MSDYIIATSSTSDLPRTYLERHEIPFISYTYTIGDTLYEDDCREESRAAVYAGMRKGDRLMTSMINEYVYSDFFTSLLKTGKDVIFLDMSQKMSVSFEKARLAADMVRGDFPGRKLYVMDTLCISGGLGLLVESMVARMESGMSYDEVVNDIAERLDLDLEHCWAYSDSASDIPMLSAVGNPVAVNPDRELEHYARNAGWEVLIARNTSDIVRRAGLKIALFLGIVGTGWLIFRRLNRFGRARR